MCTPVESAKSAVSSPLCPTPGPAAAPPVRASTPQHARMYPLVVLSLRCTAAVGASTVWGGPAIIAAGGRNQVLHITSLHCKRFSQISVFHRKQP